jgi:hypothetical protein
MGDGRWEMGGVWEGGKVRRWEGFVNVKVKVKEGWVAGGG